jgi:hypothetical protein
VLGQAGTERGCDLLRSSPAGWVTSKRYRWEPLSKCYK